MKITTKYHEFTVPSVTSLYLPGFVWQAARKAGAREVTLMFDMVRLHRDKVGDAETSLDYDYMDNEDMVIQDTSRVFTYTPDTSNLCAEILFPVPCTPGHSYVYIFEVTDTDVYIHFAQITSAIRKNPEL